MTYFSHQMATRYTQKSFLFAIVLFILTYYAINSAYSYYAGSYLKVYLNLPGVVNFFPPSLIQNQKQCELPKLDPWDPTIVDLVKPQNVYTPDPKFKVLTKLENSILTKTFNSLSKKCAYRCMYPVNDWHLRYGDWVDIGNGTVTECDIVETKCFLLKSKEKPYFEYMHAQVFRNETESESKTENIKTPNVYIIVIDSMSHSSLLRTMPKTVKMLKSEYGAIPFPHLNKVGSNSRPNGFGFLLGKQLRNISKSPISVGYKSDYKGESESCFKPLDDDQHVFSLFKAKGYKTAYMDDWATNAFTYPNCVGFNRSDMIDHTLKPFFLRIGVGIHTYQSSAVAKSVQKGNKIDEIMYPYFEKFIDAYPDEPKFSLMWSSYLAHDNNNNLFGEDAFFADFFTRNKKKFDNSYIFLMADHGMRYGDIRRTKIGEMEDSNPALIVILPEVVRQNSAVMETVMENSQQLISHYDLYATFVDIAGAKHNNGKEIVLHGSSILRPLPQPRTCDRLRIPIEFCTCTYPKSSQTTTSANGESRILASKLVDNMNEVIRTDKLLHRVCAPLTLNLNESISSDKFEADNDYAIYFVTFNVSPGNGSYRAYAGRQKDGDVTVLSSEYTRLDMYAKKAYCASSSLYISFCYCKELLRGKRLFN